MPDWEKTLEPFDQISGLRISKDDRDALVLWWKENPKKLKVLSEAKEAISSINLPKNERLYASRIFKEALGHARNANSKLIDLTGKDNPSLLNSVIRLYVPGYQGKENQALEAVSSIGGFADIKEELEFVTAVSEAVIKTRSKNPDENMIRQKVAQHVVEEMFDQLAIARRMYVHDIDGDISGIKDSPKSEKIDLTSALLSDGWTAKEQRRVRKNMDILVPDSAHKVALNTLWKWATGELPQSASVFSILDYAHELDEVVTSELAEAWRQEANRLDDDE